MSVSVTVIDQLDGTALVEGATVTNQGDGTVLISGVNVSVVDQSDGTASVQPGIPIFVLTTVDPANNPPRIRLDAGGFGGATVTIMRHDQFGNVDPVRTGNPATLDGGEALVDDYEAPYNEPVYYVATSNTGETATSAELTLTVTQPWLVHPGVPDLSQPILVAQVGDRTRDTNQGVHRPLGRADAIVITDGQRQSPTFDLTIGISSVEEERAMETLLDDTSPLLLQVVYPGSRRTMYGWVSVGTVTESDVLTYFPSEYQSWTLPCTGVSAPSGLLQAQRTLGDVKAEFTTLGGIKAAYATMRDIILDDLLTDA